MKIKEKAKLLKKEIPAIFIALSKKETPTSAKILALIIVGYALSPIDLIPDFIPILGILDDVIILPILIALVIKLIPTEIMSQCRMEAENLWPDKKPKRWYYAVPIIFLWLLVLFFVFKKLLS